jgi:amidohydrolase
MSAKSLLFIVGFLYFRAFAIEPVSSQSQQIANDTAVIRPKLIETRRDFHIHPELSNHEERTARVVAERLQALGLDEVRTNVGGYGVVALLKGAKAGPVVALRADMDALPINETIDVPYKSVVPGVKHACGHDAHTTIALGVAEVLSKMRDQIHGSVKFVFQPAEESPPPGGRAARVYDQGGGPGESATVAILAAHDA